MLDAVNPGPHACLGRTPIRRQQANPLLGRALHSQRPLAHDRPTHASADLRRVQVQFRQGPAQRVAVHAELRRGLALVAFVVGQYFKYVAPLELPDRIGIRNASTVHLRN